MSACFYIVVEGDDPGYDTYVNGHELARNEGELEGIARSLHVQPLLDFFSADRNSMAMLLEQGAGDPEWTDALPEPQWFTPHEGLVTVTALLGYLDAQPAVLGGPMGALAEELRQYERVLAKAGARRLRWHLAVSWA